MRKVSKRTPKRSTPQRVFRLGAVLVAVVVTVSAGGKLFFEPSAVHQGEAGQQMLANALANGAARSAPESVAAPSGVAPVALLSDEKDEASEVEAPVRLAALDKVPPQGANGAPVGAQRAGAEANRESSLLDETLDGSALRFAIGDKIKVTVFERVDKSGDRPLYLARADMSGEVLVEADGGAPLPFLGTLSAFDRTPSQLAGEIRRRAQPLLGSSPRVTLSIMSRQPVFVGGEAITARAVDYMPGLLLTQAVTLAGGAKLNSDRLWQQIDLAREEERLHNAERNLSLLTAKLAVLQAEEAASQQAALGGNAAAPRPPLNTTSRDASYRQDLDRAHRMRELERAEIAQQTDATEAEIGSLDEELAHLRDHVKDLEELLTEKAAKTKEAENLLGRGLTTKSSLNTLESQLRLIQVRYSEVRATILRVQTQRQQLRHRLLQFVLQERAQREREIAEAEIAVRQAESTITALSKLIDQARLRKPTQDLGNGSAAGGLVYVVARRMPDGIEEMPANLYTPLQPGDVVRVEFGAGVIVKASVDVLDEAKAEPRQADARAQ